MKRIDGVYQNPEVYSLDKLRIKDLAKLAGIWIVDGDKRLLKRKKPKTSEELIEEATSIIAQDLSRKVKKILDK